LLRQIVGQQLSMRAAGAIWDRIAERAGGDLTSLAALDLQSWRFLGLSEVKAGTVSKLLRDVASGALDLSALSQAKDAEVRSALTARKGIGPWTADMFLIFALSRPNILPLGDGGLRRALNRLGAEPGDYLSERWSPFCSLATWYLWRSLDCEVPARAL
jgi:DNA-3-methyladenine glycosylase II